MTIDRQDRLPTAVETAKDSLDGRIAIKHFHGKTLVEAEELFAEGIPLTYTEDLLWMEPVGFRFYIRAAINYCLSDRATNDSDLINGLAGTILFWQEHYATELIPCAGILADFCWSVLQQFERYDANPNIYVGLREKYQQLADTFTSVANESKNT